MKPEGRDSAEWEKNSQGFPLLQLLSQNSCYCPCPPLSSKFPVPKSPQLGTWRPLQPRSQSGAGSFCPALPLHPIASIYFSVASDWAGKIQRWACE